jgi:hypothetical protein
MRNISAGGLAKIAQKKGTEPILIIEVDWSPDATVQYADRDIGAGIKGRITQVGDLDNVIDVLNSNSSQELSVVLDDTDGSIKGIMDSQDIHQRDVRVYQWFNGLDLADKFLLFSGKVSSPVNWSEADRSVSFTIISQLEDKEFGFSAEEGQFPYLPKDLVGKPWPVIFGKVLDCPALQVNKAVSGSTLCGIGVLSGEDLHNAVGIGGTDCGLGMSLAMMAEQISFLSACRFAWQGFDDNKASELLDQINQIQASMTSAAAGRAEQQNCATTQRALKLDAAKENGLGCNPVRILGGEDFPQNTPITLNINGGLFRGKMNGDEFTISTREHPENDEKAQNIFDGIEDTQCETPTPAQFFDFSMEVPPGRGDFFDTNTIRRHGFIFCNEPQRSRPSTSQVAQHFWAEAGSRAVIASDEPITYIVSITPGTVLAVKAFKTLDGVRKLVNVPNDLWYTETKTYGTITAVQVVTRKPLSSIVDQGWDDDLYVTFNSTIGPNTVDILEYIIDNWTDLGYDTTSFNAVKTKLTPFPSNFPVLERKNTLELIRDIAFQSRCAIWLSNGVFYLKYLPEEPADDKAVTISDMEPGSIEVGFTPTEDLVTKMVVTWWLSYAEDEPNKIILRHNVNKYGTKEETYEWFIYNQPDIILKAATFWLIRKSNTWKKIKFRGFLNLLALETFDCVDLQTGSQRFVAEANVKAIVEKANYNSETNSIDFECLVPVKTGTMAKYKFFWPASLTVTDTFPTPEEIAAGNAGGDGIGTGATGELPIGYTDGINQGGTVFVGGPNVVFRANSDRGDRTPTDAGFSAQTIIPGTVFANVESSANPNPDLSLNYIDPLPGLPLSGNPASPTVIDIRKTKIVDSDNPGVSAFLSSVIRQILDSNLVIKTEAQFGDGTNTQPFDFKFDSEGGKFGAGTAFLQD